MRSIRLVPSLLVAALVCVQPVAAQSPLVLVPLRMGDVMSSAQMERTGVRHLTREQRLALDAWLTRYSAELRRGPGTGSRSVAPVAAGATPTAPGPAEATDDSAVSTDPGEQERETGSKRYRRRPVVPMTAPPGARLLAAPDDGRYVRLADGTLWEIYLPDRTATVTWRRGDYVAVSRAVAGSGEFDHVLVNAPGRTQALARFAGVPSRR